MLYVILHLSIQSQVGLCSYYSIVIEFTMTIVEMVLRLNNCTPDFKSRERFVHNYQQNKRSIVIEFGCWWTVSEFRARIFAQQICLVFWGNRKTHFKFNYRMNALKWVHRVGPLGLKEFEMASLNWPAFLSGWRAFSCWILVDKHWKDRTSPWKATGLNGSACQTADRKQQKPITFG